MRAQNKPLAPQHGVKPSLKSIRKASSYPYGYAHCSPDPKLTKRLSLQDGVGVAPSHGVKYQTPTDRRSKR